MDISSEIVTQSIRTDRFESHYLNNSFIRTIYFGLYQFTLILFLFVHSVGPWGRAEKNNSFLRFKSCNSLIYYNRGITTPSSIIGSWIIVFHNNITRLRLLLWHDHSYLARASTGRSPWWLPVSGRGVRYSSLTTGESCPRPPEGCLFIDRHIGWLTGVFQDAEVVPPATTTRNGQGRNNGTEHNTLYPLWSAIWNSAKSRVGKFG